MKEVTKWLECVECNDMFEVSAPIAEAMQRWRDESGEAFLCVECATQIAWGDAIQAMNEDSPAACQSG